MRDVPIHRLLVSDFRCIKGTRELPFDAPVVLIHGPNGTGKTSVLSALELALTGHVRSMERQSERYRAHLPYFGQPYATVRADVADHIRTGPVGESLTVAGSRLEGTPALSEAVSQFYSERCYLDQASLGRLLDLYQAREGNEQSALEKFVNELLGLEKLDALRDGLNDATDLRLLKKLAPGIDEADRQAKEAAARLREHTELLAGIRAQIASARQATRDALDAALDGRPVEINTDSELIAVVRSVVDGTSLNAESEQAVAVRQELVALGGRISALAERPTAQRILETRAALEAATAEQQAWDSTEGAKIREWEAAAAAVGADVRRGPRAAVEHAVNLASQDLDSDSRAREQVKSIGTQLDADRERFERVSSELASAHEHSSSLIESLAAVREVIDDSNTCPVCDRDFSEANSHSLLEHIDAKLSDLTTHGQQLVELRRTRDQLAKQVARGELELTQLDARTLPSDRLQALVTRHAALVELGTQVDSIDAAMSAGADLAWRVKDLRQQVEDLDATASEERHITSELARYATLLLAEPVPAQNPLESAWAQLLERAEAAVDRTANTARHHRNATEEAKRLEESLAREAEIVRGLADAAEQRKLWDERVAEAKRRQAVAKDVREAATRARTAIVHRVFTESLNDVWKAVFTRLAPNEEFIPSFGIPSATKKTFDIHLETTRRDGAASGPPQMMLSAGNLNTAALSLFLALHLAVEPLLPCLVFDDPVQAMDEVHIAQFAGLIRVLAKQNRRQVVIAVHERELFDYLALELSPAYDGDELITIELGERAEDDDGGITRHIWAPDPALAN